MKYENFRSSSFRTTAGAVLLSIMIVLPGAAQAVTQTLDSVVAYSATNAIAMQFDKARSFRTNPPFKLIGTPPSGTFAKCQQAGNGDLYCLANDDISIFTEDSVLPAVVSCRDTAMALDVSKTKPNACTAITLDLSGNIWIGGRKGSTAYSILKLVEIPDTSSCPAGSSPLTANASKTKDYCFTPFATGRPVVMDMVYLDGAVGKDFIGPQGKTGKGVVFMEAGKTIGYLPDTVPGQAVDIATKTTLGLSGTETLQGVAVLQRADVTSNRNLAVVVTNTGRVIAKNADGSGTAYNLFNVPANRTHACAATAAQFGIRVRSESRRAYISDQQCGEVSSLSWHTSPTPYPADSACAAPGGGSSFWLCNAREDLDGDPLTAPTTDLTLSTDAAAPVIGLSVAPGIPINLGDCVTGICEIVPDGGDTNSTGAQISAVKLEPGSKTGMTVFRITAIPDCRYPPHSTTDPSGLCAGSGAVKVIGGRPFLDISKLMPSEIISLFNANTVPTSLPEMLISPMYRGQVSKGFYFEGFFGRTDEGVQFRQNFNLLFDISEIAQGSLGCGTALIYPNLDWDLVTTVSERYKTASAIVATSATPALRAVDMLVNTGCTNPTAGSGSRWSFYGYNLELDPDQLPPNVFKSLSNGNHVDVYADLLDSLYEDLYVAIHETAGENIDGSSASPISISIKNSLESSWANGRDKLNKCIGAAYDKNSAANQTCQGFDSQLTGLQSAINNLSAVGLDQDKANRIGELRARVAVLFHVLNGHFLPSIPLNGFNTP